MTFFEFSLFVGNISPVVLSLGILTGLITYNRLDDLHKSLFIYLGLMLGVDISCRLLDKFYNNNLIMLPILSIIELFFFMTFYNKYLLLKSSKAVNALGVMASLFIITEFFQYFVFNTLDIKQFQPYAKVADNFVVIIMALFFFYQKINTYSEVKWTNFKLNTAVLIYLTLNAIIFLPFNFIVNGAGNAKFYIWTINIIVTLLFYIYLCVLIWKNSRLSIVKY